MWYLGAYQRNMSKYPVGCSNKIVRCLKAYRMNMSKYTVFRTLGASSEISTIKLRLKRECRASPFKFMHILSRNHEVPVRKFTIFDHFRFLLHSFSNISGAEHSNPSAKHMLPHKGTDYRLKIFTDFLGIINF